MKKFLLLYSGLATPPRAMSRKQSEMSDLVRHSWVEKVGKALVDIGAPTVRGKAVVDDGSIVQASDLAGYSVIEAENMDEALKLIEGNPFLMDKTGKFKIEVFELLPTFGV